MRNHAPEGYLICDGSEYNITDYPELAKCFKDEFGSANHFGGNGTTTFAVPDLRGEFLRGTGTNGHTNQGSGASVGSHQDGTSVPYMHSQSNGIGIYAPENYDGELLNNDEAAEGYRTGVAWISGKSYASAHYFSKVRPTNTSVLYIIKAVNSPAGNSTQQSSSSTGDVSGVQDIMDTLGDTPIPSELGTTVTEAINNLQPKQTYDWNHKQTLVPYAEPSTNTEVTITMPCDGLLCGYSNDSAAHWCTVFYDHLDGTPVASYGTPAGLSGSFCFPVFANEKYHCSFSPGRYGLEVYIIPYKNAS